MKLNIIVGESDQLARDRMLAHARKIDAGEQLEHKRLIIEDQNLDSVLVHNKPLVTSLVSCCAGYTLKIAVGCCPRRLPTEIVNEFPLPILDVYPEYETD